MLSAGSLILAAALGWTIVREIVLRRRLRRHVAASRRLLGEASIAQMTMAGELETVRAERDRLRTQNAALRKHCGAPPELMPDGPLPVRSQLSGRCTVFGGSR